MTRVVIDASAGAELVARSLRGRRLRMLIPDDAEEWVPEHFYVEVLSFIRRRAVVEQLLTDSDAATQLQRLRSWPLRRASVEPLVEAAWSLRHNMSVADALYVALADHLGAALLTDDVRLVNSPAFPRSVHPLILERS